MYKYILTTNLFRLRIVIIICSICRNRNFNSIDKINFVILRAICYDNSLLVKCITVWSPPANVKSAY